MGRGFQHVHIIWSFNLQKLKWRYSKNIMAMERARKRINYFFSLRIRFARKWIQKHNAKIYLTTHSLFFHRMGTPVSPRESKFPQYISRGFWRNYISRFISLPTATIEKIIMAKVIPILAPPNVPMAKTPSASAICLVVPRN